MPVNFKTLSMMDLRSKPGEVLDDVARSGQAYVIERNGLDKLSSAQEPYRMAITDVHEIQLIFRDLSDTAEIDVTVTLPHGYPNKAPIVSAEPIDEGCPHRWQDGSLCIYGAMAIWNPGEHDMLHVLKLCRRWIAHYLAWQQTGEWPRNGG